MVRVLCQSPVGVNCSVFGQKPEVQEGQMMLGSGEIIDKSKALQAVQAMHAGHEEDSNLSSDFNFSGSNSDSGSCSDSDDLSQGKLTIDETEVANTNNNQDKIEKRRARRRERNKICAQAYRQRRRQQNVTQDEQLKQLADRNKQLLEEIRDLEEQKSIIEGMILKKSKSPWHWPYYPTQYHPPTTTTPTGTVLVAMPMTCATMETVAMGAPMLMASDVSVAS